MERDVSLTFDRRDVKLCRCSKSWGNVPVDRGSEGNTWKVPVEPAFPIQKEQHRDTPGEQFALAQVRKTEISEL